MRCHRKTHTLISLFTCSVQYIFAVEVPQKNAHTHGSVHMFSVSAVKVVTKQALAASHLVSNSACFIVMLTLKIVLKDLFQLNNVSQ